METIIHVKDLVKQFSFASRKPEQGFFKNFFSPEMKQITAVNNINFEVNKGESLAFIGPNGAGKSTTIKMLTGILHPTSGEINVAGLNPQLNRKKLSHKIGTVFGQRSQLVFNLPVIDSFQLFGRVYGLTNKQIKIKSAKLIELFDLQEIVRQPVRKLSLGQRMRAEIAVSLLHDPEIIFLDEPTIGLDVIAKRNLRKTLKQLNQETKTTIFLTSHDTGDIEALSDRTIIVNHGRIILDKSTEMIRKEYLTEKRIKIEQKNGELLEMKVNMKEKSLSDTIKSIVNDYEIVDLDVENTSLEEVISSIYEYKET